MSKKNLKFTVAKTKFYNLLRFYYGFDLPVNYFFRFYRVRNDFFVLESRTFRFTLTSSCELIITDFSSGYRLNRIFTELEALKEFGLVKYKNDLKQ